MEYLKELEGKHAEDPLLASMSTKSERTITSTITATTTTILVRSPIIVGAGPSGLATAACLKQKGIPSLILERANCIASLWQYKTYNRLRLHLPKQYCELPLMSFPKNFPTYPTKQQFLAYLEEYVKHFDLKPKFNKTVVSAEFDRARKSWRVKALGLKGIEIEYVSQWLIVASGENAENHVPQFEGMQDFGGPILHTSLYRSGEIFRGKRVLVVGCGNSGMEICLDLCNFNAHPSLVVRDSVHVLPRKMIGRSTFGLSMWLLKWFPLRLVDQILLLMSYFVLGDTAKYGLMRPKIGPLQLKNMSGKTPVLDEGTLSSIKRGDIKVCRGVRRISRYTVKFDDGEVENFDAIILATGYKSNVPSWLKGNDLFSEESGYPRKPFPNGWKGENGLYAVGFSKRGLLGASIDARRISQDIEQHWIKLKAQKF